MQAHKLNGRVDATGQLIVTETVNLPPGDVEIIVLQKVTESSPGTVQSSSERPTKIKFLREWFTKTEPAPSDFDADEARWQALKEKYDL